MSWQQAYDPLGNGLLSALVAGIPIIVLLGTLAFLKLKAHQAALLGLLASLILAVGIFRMPVDKAGAVTIFGAAYGLFPIGWIILNVIFLYNLVNERGHFKVLQESLTGITRASRLPLLLIAFCFGAFFEGAAGFGTPVAVTAAMLIGLGFAPLAASGLSLVANTAPVAFGALGTPIIALQAVTGLSLQDLSAQTGRILPFFSIIVPFWLVWDPRRIWGLNGHEAGSPARSAHRFSRAEVVRAWMPWGILSVVVFIWGIPQFKAILDGLSSFRVPVPLVHQLVERMPPVVDGPTAEAALFSFNWLSFTGTGILVAALLSAL